MLESESKLQDNAPIIEWSSTGRAFRICDTSLFATRLLPKYFRTTNFSSFQRNLNLYGFFKTRRGPDANLYSHPSFIKGAPFLLSELVKCTKRKATVSRRTSTSASSTVTIETSIEHLDSFEEQELLPPKPGPLRAPAMLHYVHYQYPVHQVSPTNTSHFSMLADTTSGCSHPPLHDIRDHDQLSRSLEKKNRAIQGVEGSSIKHNQVARSCSVKTSVNACAAMALMSLAGCARSA